MILKMVLKWGGAILLFKMMVVLFVWQLDPDPRRDISLKERMCREFQPNTVFIGTSRTLYGVEPRLFDSLNAGESRSYNMGLFSLSQSNSMEVASRLIEESGDVEQIFIELNALDYNTILLTPFNFFDEVVFRTEQCFRSCANR